MKNTLLAILLLTYSIEGISQNYIGDKKEVKIILNNISEFSSHVMAGDHDKIGDAYTEDAKIFPNNTDIIAGRKSIIDYWKLPDGIKISHHKISPEEIKIIGSDAYDYGYYEGTTRGKDGNESSWKGKYVIIWKKVSGEWKIYLDIWNNIKDQ